MIIEVGLQYTNKTLTYLLPVFRSYGEEFSTKLSKVFKLAVGIYDELIRPNYLDERCVFILVNKNYMPNDYAIFFDYIKKHSSYISHYTPDMTKNFQVMFVLRVPENFENTYDNFIIGNYIEMYEDHEEVDIFIKDSHTKQVCKGVKTLESSFIQKINKEFKTKITTFDIPYRNYELPPTFKEEVFHNKPVNPVYFTKN